jgi:hypothetical protein
MKKLILSAFVIILLLGIIDYKYTQSKYKNIFYSAEHHLTTGIFNFHKLKTIETMSISYKNENLAIVNLSGTEKKLPHKSVKYELLLEKGIGSIWRVKKVYTLP